MQPRSERVATRLGLDETTIARLQARGQLERLALTEPDIRERLYRAHLAYLRARTRCTEASGGANGRGLTRSPSRLEPGVRRTSIAVS
jgi:hypothetical protein